jgi:hypothetical protein
MNEPGGPQTRGSDVRCAARVAPQGKSRGITTLAAMRGPYRSMPLAIALAMALAGCGSDPEATIPQTSADTLIGHLDGVEQAVANGDCDLAEAQAAEFVTTVNELPAEVGVETKEALRQAGTNLAELTVEPEQCEPAGTTDQTDTQPPPTETTAPDTTTTTTTTTDTDTDEDDEGDDEQAPAEEQPPADAGTPAPSSDAETPAPSSDEGPGGGQGGGGEPPSGGLAPGNEGEG